MIIINGEKREIRIEITSLEDEPFTIRNATYDLKIGSVTEDSGAATVDGTDVYALIEPGGVGAYKLIFTYEIADERLKSVIDISVT